jgi:endonuclease/exonuclease/phosphatase family metal-dependent hydrolase
MTYNVRSMRDDRAALGRVIGSAEADVVLIQESPRFLRWRSLCAQLARTSGLVVVGGGRPAGSNLILCAMAVQVVSTRSVLFSKDPRLHQRGTAIAVLRKQGATFAVAGTHLDLAPGPRLRHVGELEAAVSAYVPAGVPTIVGGDINDHPGSPVWAALAARRTDVFAAAGVGDGFTSTARQPHQVIDGLFADPAFTVQSARVLDGPDVLVASDHRPLRTEVELG